MWPFFIFTNNNRNDFDPTPWELRKPKAYIRSGIIFLFSWIFFMIMHTILTTLATEFPHWFIPDAKFWMNITLGSTSGLYLLLGIYFFSYGFFKYSKALKKFKEENKAQEENDIDNQQNSTTKLDNKNITLMKNKDSKKNNYDKDQVKDEFNLRDMNLVGKLNSYLSN